MNETDPIELSHLSVRILESIKDCAGSSHEKAAALRLAATAIEQAVGAQNSAMMFANYLKQSKG